ncbi:MAG TPA: ATP-binding protein [Streptosporangiaceae bacterium]|jgi:anti-sigma regulatory factor (Ser/Thr protein kinase)|nr:ATP-binding protein [Streptosporangiaceae bacterium]
MTGEASVITLDRRWSGEATERSGDLLDVVFGWTDIAELRRLVTARCEAAGLTGSRLEDFALAVHEIAANAIVHAGEDGRLVLQRVTGGLRCLVADTIPKAAGSCPAPRSGEGELPEPSHPADHRDNDSPAVPLGAVNGRGLWLAATLADELAISSGPESTTVSLYMRLD